MTKFNALVLCSLSLNLGAATIERLLALIGLKLQVAMRIISGREGWLALACQARFNRNLRRTARGAGASRPSRPEI